MRGGWGAGGRVEGCGINAEELMGRDGRVSYGQVQRTHGRSAGSVMGNGGWDIFSGWVE